MLTCPRCGSNYTKDLEFCGLDGERLVQAADDPLIGKTIDRYQITGLIGDGGMARVYRATHVYLEQACAIKVLHGEVASDKALAKRFQREAQAASKIKHPNVVSIIDFGTSQDGLIFMAMELLSGRTLSDAIAAEAPYPPARAATIVRALAEGLSAAHAHGFVHRDLKPRNVMLVPDQGREVPKILDFGLVMLTDSVQSDATSLTKQGQVFGTPAYMSPEQIAGSEVDARADLYALGVILYQMLTAHVPFEGNAAQIAVHHMSTPPARIDDHGELGTIAMALLAKDREARPKSAEEVIALIDRLDLADVPVPSLVPAKSEKPVTQELDLQPSISSLPSLGVLIGDDGPGSPPPDLRPVEPRAAEEDVQRTSNMRAPKEVTAELETAALGGGGMLWGVALAVVLALVGGVFAYRTFWRGPQVVGTPEASAGERDSVETPKPVRPKRADRPKKSVKVEPPRVLPEPVREETKRAEPSRAEQKAAPAVETAPAQPEPKSVAKARMAPAERPADPKSKPAKARAPHEAQESRESHDSRESREEAAPSGRSFQEVDLSLGWLLSKRGLSWRDVAAVASDDVEQWSLWRIGADHPSPEELDRTASSLEHTINTIRIDKHFVEAKLDRVQAVLAAFPAQKKGRGYVSLEERFREAKRVLDRVKRPHEVQHLCSEVTMLESNALAEASGAEPLPTARKGPSLPSLSIEAPRIEDTDSSTESRRPSM